MRKKISSILIGFLLVFAGVFASACGDKYKNFEFSLTYAFSENAENWYNANDGISLNYLEDGNEYVFDINGKEERVDKNNFNIYLKVQVNNVKSKHLDSVTISAEGSSGLSFSSSTIKNGKTIKLPIVGLVNSQLSFYENKSGRSTKIDLTVYGKLTDITRNESITPAVVVGNSVDLNSIASLVTYNELSGITTNQTGVEFSFMDFGSFTDAGIYVADSAANNLFNKQFVSLVKGKLKLNQKIRVVAGEREFALTSANNVIRIKATSVYDNEISTDIYVYVVENNLSSPLVTFANGANAGKNVNSADLTRTGLDLYFNSTSYIKSTVEVNDVDSVYNSGSLKTADGYSLKFRKVVYIGDSVEPYVLDSSEPVRNLRISENDGEYTITLLTQSIEEKVDVKFAYELVAEKDGQSYPVNFTQGKPNLATSVEVRKHILPSSILVNGKEYKDGETLSGIVYSADRYEPYKIQLGIDPIDKFALVQQTNIISGIENLEVKDQYSRKVENNDLILPNTTLSFKFKNGIYKPQNVTIKTLSTPTYFDGKESTSPNYIQIGLKLEMQVTADALEFVSPVYDKDTSSVKYEQTSTINVATNKNSYVYVKAYYKGELEPKTITLLSGDFALNNNGDKKVLLSADNITRVLTETGYSIYRVEIPGTANVASSNLKVYAGEIGFGAQANVELVAVNLINDATKIQVLPKDESNVTKLGTETDNWFAIIKDLDITFNVVEDVAGEKVHKTIKNVTLTDVDITNDAIKDKFGRSETLVKTEFRNTNTFNIHGWNAKTRVFNVHAEYYDLVDVDSDGFVDIVSLQTKTIPNVQFAVYNPITNITMNVSNSRIAYVNSMYPEAATTEVSYNSRSGLGGDVPTQEVYFIDKDGNLHTESNATSVQISVDKDLDVNQVNLYHLVGQSYSVIPKDEEILLTNNGINGKLKLQLSGTFSRYSNVKFIATAKRFGKLSSIQKDIPVIFADVEKANGFNITKGDIVEYSNETRELQLSFMGVDGNTVSKSFGASPVYPTAVPSENTLQFKDVAYYLYKYDYKNGVLQYEADGVTPKLVPITDLMNSLQITNVDGLITVTADKTKTNIGGLYRLVLVTKDSYKDADGSFEVSWPVDVRVSDGKTIDAAYIIRTADEFMSINNDLTAHYVLGDNISISSSKFTSPIGVKGSIATPFAGTLSGRLQTFTDSGSSSISNYNLVVTLNNNHVSSAIDGEGSFYGLFTILTGSITNLNIHIDFLEKTASNNGFSTDGMATVGGIAAINRGRIENVYAYLSGVVELNGVTDFGGIVGVNQSKDALIGTIKNCMVDSSSGLLVKVKASSNIGGVVGLNSGVIQGRYNGKDSLNNIVYDSIVNLTISNLTANIKHNIGSIAGKATSDINNLLVGGKINLTSKREEDGEQLELKGYLAGIVGDTSANVTTVAAVGLDLTNGEKNGINVAGIAGEVNNIEDAKFVSVLAKFNSAFVTKGEIVGRNVAGIAFVVATENASVDGVEGVNYSSVESFIKTKNDSTFYTLSGETVYGLIKSGSVINSFVSANIELTELTATTETAKAYLTSENKNDNATYFIGQVSKNNYDASQSTYSVVYNNENFVDILGFDFDETKIDEYIKTTENYVDTNTTIENYLKAIDDKTVEEIKNLILSGEAVFKQAATDYELIADVNDVVDGTVYYLLVFDKTLYYNDGEYKEINNHNWLTEILSFDTKLYEKTTEISLMSTEWNGKISGKSANFDVNSDYNIVMVSDFEGIGFYFPYIVKDGKPLMILQPSSIGVAINQGYQISTEANIYIDDVVIKDNETPPTYEITESIVVDFFKNKYDNNTDVNKHYLVNNLCNNCKSKSGTCLDAENCNKGLIDVTILPNGSTNGLTFELVANYMDLATIVDNTYIVFSGATGDKPIIVRAYSMFNPEAEAYFAIYSQQTFTDLILNGDTVTESKESNIDYVVNVLEGKNSLMSITANNTINGVSYDSIFTSNSHFVKVEAEILDADKNKIVVNTSNLTAISVAIKDDYKITNKNESVTLTFNVYLDKLYFKEFGTFGSDEIGLLLGSITVKVNLVNLATKLDIVGSDDFEMDTSSTLNVEADLKTGFVNLTDSTTEEVQLSTKVESGVVIVNEQKTEIENKKDSIRLSISSESAELERVRLLTGRDSYADLFDYEVFETRYSEGYKYFINLTLKDEFDYRYITEEIDLLLEIWAYSSPNVQNSVSVKIKPTTASTTRLVNYAVESVNVVSDTKSELTIGNVETAIIAPGGRGNIILAYVEKSYSNIDSISISSSDLLVPELNRNVNLIFTQYVYNTDTKKFETLFNSDVQAQKGNTLQLQKITTTNNRGETEYTGLLYIHAQLVKFSGLEAKITASLNVTSNGKVIKPVDKDLLTTFLPGASLNYIGETIRDGYHVQESTYGNSAKIKLYGYQFNSNPTMLVDWHLVDGVNYFYHIDGVYNKLIDLSGKSADEKKTILEEEFKKGTLYYNLAADIKDGKKTIQAKGYYKATEADLIRTESTLTFYSVTNKKLIWIDKNADRIVDESEKLNVSNYVSPYFVKDYEKVNYNPVDGSYTMDVEFNIAKDIPANFTMQAALSLITSDGQLENAYSDKLMFYPSKYVITDVSVKNTSGNRKMLAINRTDKFELLFTTLREDYDFSTEIYEDIFVEDITNLASLFTYYTTKETSFADEHAEFDVAIRNDYLSVTGLSKFEKEVTLSVWVGYSLVNGKYEVVFGEGVGSNMKKFEYSFLLQIYPGAGEENATPIYYDYEMFGEDGTCKLAENGHYILMNDITLDLVKPIDYPIGSLDGNNHIIKIRNFVIDKSKTEYGLFANIGTYQDEEKRTHKTILKNVVVDYSEFNVENNGNIEFTNNEITSVTFGGLVGTNNGGLIYNCDVINSNVSINKTINILTDANASLTFGGLVGSNSGVITNSRVGRREFEDIDAVNDTSVDLTFGGLTFALGSATSSGFDVVAGGFVGTNKGTISSSYFANSNLINYSNSKETNITAGFAGRNNSNASIVYSYVKANETTINSTSPYATGARIEGKSDAIIAGFVYQNAGNIKDCYANTELYTNSAYMAGFVYKNESSGEISESYAACTMNSKLSGESQDNAEQPFIGRDNENNYLDLGVMTNNYYLISDGGSGDVGTPSAQALNATNFKNPNNLQGFVFVESNVTAERQQGVWSHIDIKGNSVILPELMNANIIAHSAKYLYSGNGTTDKFIYTNADSYMEGTQQNPFIIRNVQEFNNTLTGDRADLSEEISKPGFIRLIDSIDFGEDKDAIKTRVKYTLGDENSSNVTSFEGNGLSISGIYFDVSEPGINEIGLFAKILNAYVKNVNLNFVKPKTGGQYSTTLVKYSGGLAGIITDSAIINVNLNGRDVALTGQNYVGGLAGLIKGSSLLYGITSNLSVSASSPETGLYYSQKDYDDLYTTGNYASYISNLSYAGGIAGVIDITKRANTENNIAYIDIYGDQMFVKTSDNGVQLPNISGQYAGGIAGFASRQTNSLKLKYHTGTTDWISGSMAAGGLFGVSLGNIKASQVTAVEDVQFEIDEEFGKYILDVNKGLDETKLGNLNLIESNGYAGGLIGIGLNAGIDASYSKATIKNGNVVGGLIGLSVASHVTYSYANPFVNVSDKTKAVGGLFGAAHIVEKNKNLDYNLEIRQYENLTNLYLNRDPASARVTYTDIQFTFSTLLLDKDDLVKNQVSSTKQDSEDIKLGYIVPNLTNNANVENLRCGGNTTFTNVYEGVLDEYSYTKQGETDPTNPVAEIEKIASRKLEILYDLSHNKQETTFNEIFSAWKSVSYWSLKHEKYFPLLTNEGVENYIVIENAKDFEMISSNLDGKFLITQDINMAEAEWVESNWVIAGNFTGELIGLIDSASNTRKRIYNISLNPDKVDSSGFFLSTQGATIADLEFEWLDSGAGAINPTENNIKQLTAVSGLSCLDLPYGEDENARTSEFNNIEVSVYGGGSNVTGGYLLKQPDDTSKSFNINSFGGIVASTKNSSLLNCDFIGKVDVNLTGDEIGASYFGGLVGKASKKIDDKGMSIMNSNVGANGEDTSKATTAFTVNVVGGTQTYVGGIAGSVENTSVWGANVGGINYTNSTYTTVSLNVKISEELTGDPTQRFGGLVGYSGNSAINRCDTNANITVSTYSNVEEKKELSYTTIIGGLVADYFDEIGMDIVNANANAEIDISELNTGTLYVAGGVALISTYQDVETIKHSLFTGKIIAEKEVVTKETTSTKFSASTIVAGGAIATASNKVQISETMSTVDTLIGTNYSGDHSIKAGGFVGLVSEPKSVLILNNVVSTGKLVPICGETCSVHVGGLVGSVDNNNTTETTDDARVIINNAYTLTSIISDAINGIALENTYSDALIGYANETTGKDGKKTISNVEANNVHYSTDFALTTNNHKYGTNHSAYDMVFDEDNIWMQNFVTSTSIWEFLDVDNRLPYLKGIEDSLKKYKVLNMEGDKFDYNLGSSLRPISGNFTELKAEFSYYILESKNTFNTTLNGVLIGKEYEFKTEYNFVVNSVNKHSAISNIHLKLDDLTYTLDGSINGFIANENNGLIFNSSVQGKNVTILNKSALNKSPLGVIAGKNNGTVSYSYSTIEIISVSCPVSGIVNGNDGVINSCYFTGYINNESENAAGIMLSKSEGDDGKNSYVYNSYMAGVIEKIQEDHSSFYAGDVATLVGSNNYIDQFANIELDVETVAIKSVSTAELMAKAELKGNWYDSVEVDSSNNVTLDTRSNEDLFAVTSFGKNYGYPIYEFNKIQSLGLGVEPICSDLNYSLDTGNGNTTLTTPTLEDRYSALSSENGEDGKNAEYEAAYKIPHLGVLRTLHGLQGESRNYVVIYDIDGDMINWQGVASSSENLNEYVNDKDSDLTNDKSFKSSGSFNGVLVTNKNFANTYKEDKPTEHICTIQGLNGSGIFDDIGESYIADIILGNFGKKIEASEGIEARVGLSNSGPLGNKVLGNTTVNKITYVKNSVIEGKDFGGLFGSVASTVTISNLITTKENIPLLTLQGSGSAGLIANSLGAEIEPEIKSGTITFVADEKTTPVTLTNTLSCYFKSVDTAGGIVGTAVQGTINGNNHVVDLDLPFSNYTINNFGGIIGTVGTDEEKSSEVVTVNNLIVNFYHSEPIIAANTFGGFAAIVKGSATFYACKLNAAEDVEVKSNAAGSKGLVIGKIEGATAASVSLTSFEFVNDTIFNFVGDNNAESSIGGIVGYQNGDLKVEYTNSKTVGLTTTETPNMGGIIGIYKGGNINFSNVATGAAVMSGSGSDNETTLTGTAITLKGVSNVGGFIGYASAFPEIIKPEEQKEDIVNFLNLNKFATIVITESSISNFGGIFGVLTASNTERSSGDDKITTSTTEDESYTSVNNNNEFKVEKLDKKATATISNLGGVVGFVNYVGDDSSTTYVTLGDLTNSAEIKLSEAYGYKFANIGGVIGKFSGVKLKNVTNEGKIICNTEVNEETTALVNAKVDGSKINNYPIAMNVGGIIGLTSIDKEDSPQIELIGLTNTASINGYQNVGGLVGYAKNVSITGLIELEVIKVDGELKVKPLILDEDGKLDNAKELGEAKIFAVSGVVNVGGVAGYVESSTIQQVNSVANVYGNVNVGGIVGLSNNGSTIKNNYVGYNENAAGAASAASTDTSDTKAVVKALYYNVYFNDNGAANYISYIPTSVGGLIGTSSGTTIQSNILQNVQILSADEGKETSSVKNSKGIISTIKNNMANIGFGTGSAGIDNFTKSDIKDLYLLGSEGASNRTLEFAAIQSGFGGFVGTIDLVENVLVDSETSGEVGTTSTDSEKKSSYMRNVTINAPLGVNVGAFYGVFTYNNTNEGKINAPTIYGEINVDGAYNIGSISGKISATEIKELSNANLQGEATINVQPNLSGMYVGGLIGVMQSNVVNDIELKNIQNKVNIKICTDSSYYIGGLVGKLLVSAENTFNGKNYTQPGDGSVYNDDDYNFGGLVGMLKCAGNVDTYSVNGTHYYSFTVNTIENQNYAEGKSQFSTWETQDSVNLGAQAYYINQDSFDISATSSTYYVNGNNPVRPGSIGWAKEYTGFKQVQRCIPAGKNIGADWDSIAFVYNAENISNVKTIANAKANGDSLDGISIETEEGENNGKYYYTNDEGRKEYLDENYIIYTIYDKAVDKPMLYCASGIAELLTDDEGNAIVSEDSVRSYHYKKAKDDPRYLGGTYNLKLNWPWNGEVITVEFNPANSDNGKITNDAYKEMSLADMIWFDWTNTDNTMLISLPVKPLDNDNKDQKFSTELCHYEVDGKYYFFKTIYANRSILGDLGTKYIDKTDVSFSNYTINNVSSSGSVFEVCGLKPDFQFQKHEKDNILGWIIAAVLVVLYILCEIFITKGALTKVLIKVIKIVIKFLKSHPLLMKGVKAALQVAAIIASVGIVASIGKTQSSDMFFNTTGQNLGLLTSTTVTEITYDENINLKGGVSEQITVLDLDGTEYTYNFYSTQKPQDYYGSYYFAVVDFTDPSFNFLEEGKDLTQGYNKEKLGDTIENVSVTIGDEQQNLKYKFKFKDTTDVRDVNLKYIYYEGKYYSHNMAVSIGHYETNELSKLDTSDMKDYEYYYDENGVAHVMGKYIDGEYRFNPTDENLLKKYKSSEFTDANLIKDTTVLDDQSGVTFALNGVTIPNYYTYKETEFYCKGPGSKNDGYEYITGAYYTTIGNSNAQISPTEYAVDYAKFIYSDSRPNGTNGIDYVEFSHDYYVRDKGGIYKSTDEINFEELTHADYNEDGTCKIPNENRYNKTTQSPVYFKITSAAQSEDKSVLNANRAITTGDTISLALYPYSLYNPYDTENQSLAESEFKDNYEYRYQSDNTSAFKVKAKVKYYYYDGGYLLGKDLLTDTSVYNNTDAIDSFEDSIYRDVTDFYTVKKEDGTVDYISEDYTLYKGDGTKEKLTYSDIFNKYSDYKDYYTANPTELVTEADRLTDAQKETLLEPFKLKYLFAINEVNKIYERKDLYKLDTTTGKINKLYPIVAKAQGGIKVHLSNRYLTNKDYGLYTMFKYTGSEGRLNFYYEKEKSVWKIDRYDSEGNKLNSPDYYYVIPLKERQRRPNNITTYLSESCKVTLGGGYNLQYTGMGNAKSGTISIKDPS